MRQRTGKRDREANVEDAKEGEGETRQKEKLGKGRRNA